jgi:glutathione S-transferase
MITLFYRPRTRSARFVFLLEELGVPYEIKQVTTLSNDGSGARDAANPHPHGKVPAISDDGQVVFESAAIVLYLTDKFPKSGIGPLVGDPKRGLYLSLLAYYCGVLEPAFMMKFMKVETPRGTAGWVPVEEAIVYLSSLLEKGPYLLGDKFSAVDVLYGTMLAMFMGGGMLPKTPLLEAYTKRVTERPASTRAQEREKAL